MREEREGVRDRESEPSSENSISKDIQFLNLKLNNVAKYVRYHS